VSITTNGTDLDELVAFYRDLLGLGDAERPDLGSLGGHWHTLADQQLHLVDVPARPAAEPTGDIDPTGPHWCVEVDDLAAAVAELDARGIRHVGGTQTTPSGDVVAQVWCCDPAGNTIELQQDRSRR
jgi:catechol 2,3-dioxygenase-like lactoylglutathione lyase family enzyme